MKSHFSKNSITFTYFLLVATLSRARLCQEPELLLHVVRQIRLVDGHEEGATAAVAHGGRDLHDVAPVHAESEGLHVTRHLRSEIAQRSEDNIRSTGD